MEAKGPTARLVPLREDIVLESCDVDEIRQFRSLRIRIRDRNDVGVEIEFERDLGFRVYDEGVTLRDPLYVRETGYNGHWLYESWDSDFLRWFREQSFDTRGNSVKNYIIMTSNDKVEVLSVEPPKISMRTDTMRGWIRPGESPTE